MLPLHHNLTVSSSERKHNNEAKTDVHSTAFCLALGLTTGAWAADGLSGQSYTVSDGVIRLFAPQGYEGTETIALPSGDCGHTGHSVTWTVQDGKGTLKLNHCWRYDSTGWYGICIDGGSTLADAVIELEGSFTYSYLHTTGVDLTLCSAASGSRQKLELRANYGGASHPEGNVVVEGGDLLIQNLYLSTMTDIRNYENYRQASMRQINVPNGSVTVDEKSHLSTYSSSVWSSRDDGGVKFDAPAVSDIHVLADTLIVEGAYDAWSRGQENVKDAVISASSIRFGECYVTIDQTGGERRSRFQVTPEYGDASKVTETWEDVSGDRDYHYSYDNVPRAANDVPAFTDVSESAWYYDDVRYACQTGLMKGKSSVSFAPDDNLTVAEAVKLACCIRQWDEERRITLTNGSPWYASYMQFALDNGIIYEDLTVRANEPITRQEYILLFSNAIISDLEEINTVEPGAIPDATMGGRTEEVIYEFYRAGILTGAEGGAFVPDSLIKRSEVCAVLARILNPDNRVSFTLTA